jgi:hypothetical protein
MTLVDVILQWTAKPCLVFWLLATLMQTLDLLGRFTRTIKCPMDTLFRPYAPSFVSSAYTKEIIWYLLSTSIVDI